MEGNEILNVIQRRLLARAPDVSAADVAADAHGQVFTQMRRAHGTARRSVYRPKKTA